MTYGYMGKVLHVDLTSGLINIENPPELFYRTYFGGRGFVAHWLLKEVPPGTDPLGPENRLVFATGVLTGLPFGGSGRQGVGVKSPLTGGYGEAEGGGFWGAELKRAGFDAIVVKGQAPRPVYLWVHDDEAELRDATHLWGGTTGETWRAICEELGDSHVRVTAIGPAGENLVRYAAVIFDLSHAAGRSGIGAVMGSKNLKAIAVRGTQKPEVADPETMNRIARWLIKNYRQLLGDFPEHGTAVGAPALSAAGAMPTRNFSAGSFEEVEAIGGRAMSATILTERDTCFACPVRCKRVVEVKEPHNVDPMYGGPEYETVAALGSLCGVGDLKAIAKANEICNAASLDTISSGATIALAMNCFEAGIIDKKDTEGLELRFGNAEAMLEVLQQIVRREGFGALLAEGVKRVSEKWGPEAQELAYHVKGKELPMHDPRMTQQRGIGFAVCPSGADHLFAWPDQFFHQEGPNLDRFKALGILEPQPLYELSEKKVRNFVYSQLLSSFLNCAMACFHLPYQIEHWVDLTRAATGWNSSAWEILKVGERAVNLARVYNIREGFGPDEDVYPEIFFKPSVSGALKGVAVDEEQARQAIKTYYSMMGWDENGVPSRGKLEELNVGWVADLLEE